MAWVVKDFECEACECVWEDLVDRDNQVSVCPVCETESTKTLISCPNINTFGMKSAAERSSLMKKRSEEHTRKELRKEPEKFGAEGIKRAREGQIRSK